MPDPIQQAIEMFRLNLQVLELREHFYDYEQAFWSKMGWSFKVTSTFTGFAWQRNHRKGVERLQARKAQYARAIRELYEGKTDFAAIQLQQMAREALNLDQRTSFWRRFGFDRPMYRLPTPLAPGVLYGPQVRSKTFIATVKLLRELS